MAVPVATAILVCAALMACTCRADCVNRLVVNRVARCLDVLFSAQRFPNGTTLPVASMDSDGKIGYYCHTPPVQSIAIDEIDANWVGLKLGLVTKFLGLIGRPRISEYPRIELACLGVFELAHPGYLSMGFYSAFEDDEVIPPVSRHESLRLLAHLNIDIGATAAPLDPGIY